MKSLKNLEFKQINRNEFGRIFGGAADYPKRSPAGSVTMGAGTSGEKTYSFCWDCTWSEGATPYYCQDDTTEPGCQCER